MKKFTRSIIATACLAVSFSALAHEHNYKDDYKNEAMPLIPLTIPVLAGGMDVTLGGLWLRPSSSNTEYLSWVVEPDTVGTTPAVGNFSVNEESVNPQYTWGFLLGLGYVFPHSANDIRVNWMHLDDDGDSDSTDIDGPVTGSIAVFPFGFGTRTLTSATDHFFDASAEVSYDVDAVDLTLGQYINIGPRLQTRLFAGLRWARIENELDASYADSAAFGLGLLQSVPPTETMSFESESTFHGIGPMMGIEGTYDIGYNIGLSGYFDAALLVGKTQLSQHGTANDFDGTGALTDITNIRYNYDDVKVVAPAWDARFGINYTYTMNNGSAFKFELGYQATKYLDVIEMADLSENNSLVETVGGTVSHSVTQNPSNVQTINFGLNGLYFSGMLRI